MRSPSSMPETGPDSLCVCEGAPPYPASGLAELMERLLAQVRPVPDPVQALVVPHGGLARTGALAAEAYGRVGGRPFERIVVLVPAPPEREGAAVRLLRTRLATPLGELKADQAAIELLGGYPEMPLDGLDSAVPGLAAQLPFVQRLWPEARLVPVLVGRADGPALEAASRRLRNVLDEDTLAVAACGLTHGSSELPWAVGPEAIRAALGERARLLLRALSARDAQAFSLLRRQPGAGCGLEAVELLMRTLGPGPEAKVAGEAVHLDDRASRAASFAAVRLEGRFPTVPELASEDLLALGRIAEEAVASAVHRREPRPLGELSPRLRQRGGAFVTVYLDGELKGCMGRLDADHVALAVAMAGRMAAADDPRFPSLRPDELARATLEVSVLGPFKPIADPEDFEPGRHGLLLTEGWNRGLLLPQVASRYGMDREEFLEALARKAGLPKGGWRRARLLRFGVQAFEPRPVRPD